MTSNASNEQPISGGAIMMDDLAALRRYATVGDPRAFEVLVERYQAMVLATCFRATRNVADAEDAAQETFLKLARAARQIRSNAGAWIHACALRTSIDLIRRKGSMARAEQTGTPAQAGEVDEQQRTWQEIKPELDRALAALSDEDRELIVQRFLVGRTEADMAREARVVPGTMNRRIDRALTRLRENLGAAGVTAGAGAVAAALQLAAQPPGGAALGSSLMEIGLAGMASQGAAAATSGTLALLTSFKGAAMLAGIGVLSAATLLVATGGLGGGSRGSGTASAGTLATPEVRVVRADRPTKAIGPFPITDISTDAKPVSTMTILGSKIHVVDFGVRDGKPVTAEIIARLGDIGVSDAKAPDFRAPVSITFESCNQPDSDIARLVGQTVPAKCEIVDDRLTMSLQAPGPDGEATTNSWRGARPTPEQLDALRKASPVHASMKSVGEALIPGIDGTWFATPPWELSLTPDEIRVSSGQWEAARYKILEWVTTGDIARVQVLCTRNHKAMLIGERLSLLVRAERTGPDKGDNEPNAYALALHEQDRARFATTPKGFELKPGSGVTIITARKETK
ncbi:MAG: sigma-70 family RNA polymerase sigma factor [Planctomycetota bacterium]|nr:sigma-70 family RNA polymerase sigma factor [Planctomycetota bacterium]